MRLTTTAVFVAGISVAACQPNAGSDGSADDSAALGPTTVATVNGEPVHESLLRLYAMSTMQRNLEQLNEEERDRALEDLVQFELLTQEAERQGLPQERRVAAELELERLRLLARTMAVRYLEENPATEAELRALYEENLPQLVATQYKARHILLESESNALEVIALLDEGRDFAELARERSTGPTGPQGGDLGYFTPDSMVEPFANAVKAMEAGSYSEAPVQTQFGWHVILVEDIREQEAPGLEAVRADLERQRDRRKVEELVSGLRERATVDRQEGMKRP